MPSHQRQSQLRHPEHHRARTVVAQALKSGKLARPQECEDCGHFCGPEAHHDDYLKPLEVRWLCKPCHAAADAARRQQDSRLLRAPGSRPADIKREPVTCTACQGAGTVLRVNPASVRQFRESHGWTLRRMARQIGVSPTHLSDLELGRRALSDEIASQITAVCLSAEEIV